MCFFFATFSEQKNSNSESVQTKDAIDFKPIDTTELENAFNFINLGLKTIKKGGSRINSKIERIQKNPNIKIARMANRKIPSAALYLAKSF